MKVDKETPYYEHFCLTGIHWIKMINIFGYNYEQFSKLFFKYLHDGRSATTDLSSDSDVISMILWHQEYTIPNVYRLCQRKLPVEIKILLFADTFVNFVSQKSVFEALINIRRFYSKYDRAIVERITSNPTYNPGTYRHKNQLCKLLERERIELQQLVVEHSEDFSNALVYGQSQWVDILLIENLKWNDKVYTLQ